MQALLTFLARPPLSQESLAHSKRPTCPGDGNDPRARTRRTVGRPNRECTKTRSQTSTLPMAKQIPDERAPWDRQEGESLPAWSAFRCYRDMDRRSLSKVGQALGKSKTLMSRWSARWDWTGRVAVYDADLDRRVRLKFLQAQVEARERHARVAQAALTTLTIPVRAMLDALQDPTVLERLTRQARESSDGLFALLGVVVRCASVIPAIIKMERLSLGMTTDSIEVDARDVLARDLSFADRITGDPEAVQLAIALLDRVAGQDADTRRRHQPLDRNSSAGHDRGGPVPRGRTEQGLSLDGDVVSQARFASATPLTSEVRATS